MIDYSKIQVGQRLRITGMGAPGFAKLGDMVIVEECTAENHGKCRVRHLVTNKVVDFVLTCGAQRLEEIVEAQPDKPTVMEIEGLLEKGVRVALQPDGTVSVADGCCCTFAEDGETQLEWCSVHAILREDRDRLRKAVAFFACTIRSGEPWTDRCEQVFIKAMAGR